MRDEIINEIPEILRKHICTLKKVSLDNSCGKNMCDSIMTVVDFDKIPNDYSRGKRWRVVPKSNDALYIASHDKWYFIEFKNGEVKKHDIYRKLYDSLIMLVDMGIITGFDSSRDKIVYILVYNSDKISVKAEKSESRDSIYSYISDRSGKEERLFGIDKFEGYLFKETHTYTIKQFIDNFIEPMEQVEGIA